MSVCLLLEDLAVHYVEGNKMLLITENSSDISCASDSWKFLKIIFASAGQVLFKFLQTFCNTSKGLYVLSNFLRKTCCANPNIRIIMVTVPSSSKLYQHRKTDQTIPAVHLL